MSLRLPSYIVFTFLRTDIYIYIYICNASEVPRTWCTFLLVPWPRVNGCRSTVVDSERPCTPPNICPCTRLTHSSPTVFLFLDTRGNNRVPSLYGSRTRRERTSTCRAGPHPPAGRLSSTSSETTSSIMLKLLRPRSPISFESGTGRMLAMGVGLRQISTKRT